MAKDYISQFEPVFYKQQYGEVNAVTVANNIFNQIINDILEYKFNRWNDKNILKDEFKTDKVITSGFKMRNIEFLKSFFVFKGTNSDLYYILNNLGYKSTLFNDGGILHQDDPQDPSSRKVVPVQEFKGIPNECEVEIQVQLNLNDPNFKGYTSIDIEPIIKVIKERLSVCAYLHRTYISFLAKENYETVKETRDTLFEVNTATKTIDSYFEIEHQSTAGSGFRNFGFAPSDYDKTKNPEAYAARVKYFNLYMSAFYNSGFYKAQEIKPVDELLKDVVFIILNRKPTYAFGFAPYDGDKDVNQQGYEARKQWFYKNVGAFYRTRFKFEIQSNT